MHKSNVEKHVGKNHPRMSQIEQNILVNGEVSYYRIVENISVFKSAKNSNQQICNVCQYKEHNINEKPYIFLKADSGTYGMGVMPIEDPEEIMNLNRKNRNKLYKGKSAKIIDRFLLQEGIPSIENIENEISEAVIYQIENTRY